MIPTMLQRMIEVAGAYAVLTGAMAWFRIGSKEEDEVYAEAADILIEAISDGDDSRTTACRTGNDWREISLEQVLDWDRERRLRRMDNRN